VADDPGTGLVIGHKRVSWYHSSEPFQKLALALASHFCGRVLAFDGRPSPEVWTSKLSSSMQHDADAGIAT
jgi:hypothetical protein